MPRGAAISTGSASCAAISPAGATASPRPSCTPARPGRTRAPGGAGDRLRGLAAERSPDQARPLPHGAWRRGAHAVPRSGAGRVRLPPARRSQGAQGRGQVAAAALGRATTCRRPQPFAQEARLHRAGRRMDRAARRASLGPWSRRSRGCARSASPARSRRCSASPSDGTRRSPPGRCSFYALWHRRHIERRRSAPDVFAALG